jgi:hypothetical protein
MACDTNDFIYPLIADVYYSIVKQGAYGEVAKQWILDKSVACNFNPTGANNKPGLPVNVELMIDDILIGRTRCDIRTSSDGDLNALTNILITNIRDTSGNSIYNETSGIRKSKTTLFEIGGNEPIVGPFGSTEYWKVLIRRSENQGVDV